VLAYPTSALKAYVERYNSSHSSADWKIIAGSLDLSIVTDFGGDTNNFYIQKMKNDDPVYIKNKEERYSRVPRLSDTRYSKGNGDMQAAKRN